MSRSWKELRSADEKETLSLSQRVRRAFKRMPQEDRECLQEWLMRTKVMREVNVGAPDGAFRDAAAERRVALSILNLLNGPDHEPRGSDTD